MGGLHESFVSAARSGRVEQRHVPDSNRRFMVGRHAAMHSAPADFAKFLFKQISIGKLSAHTLGENTGAYNAVQLAGNYLSIPYCNMGREVALAPDR